MIEFFKTLSISLIPAVITGVSAYLAAKNNSNTQIKSISEQNKADIEKLIEEHKINLDSLKEKHRMELEMKEKDHQYQAELIKLQHNNDLAKSEDSVKNQAMSSFMGNVFGGLFSSESAITKQLNDAIEKSFEDTFNNSDE